MTWQRGFALSPDGRFLVWPVADESIHFKDADQPNVTRTGSRLRMMDLTTGALVERFGGFEGDAHDLHFIAGGKTLVTTDRYRRGAGVRLWDVATGKLVRSFPAAGKPDERVWRSRLSPDGKVLAVMYQRQTRGPDVETEVRPWDLASGKELAGPTPHWFDPDVVTFTPDGKTMAAATPDGRTIQLEDPATGQVREGLRGLSDRATALALGPDGRLYTGFADGTVLVWDPKAVKPPPTNGESPAREATPREGKPGTAGRPAAW
jgi:WD40 repeat protein